MVVGKSLVTNKKLEVDNTPLSFIKIIVYSDIRLFIFTSETILSK